MTPALVRALPETLDDVEVVEHKGAGHPDTLCDGAAEAASRALSRAYLADGGRVLHHNVDKALLVGGRSRASFGGGEILEPMRLYLAGRASEPSGRGGDARAIVAHAARAHLREVLHAADVDRDVRVEALVRPASADLADLFARGRLANDTSAGAGYAPLSVTERCVLAVAGALGRRAREPSAPEVGEDVKVMALRRGRRLALTVACAMIGRHLSSLSEYVARRDAVLACALEAARAEAGSALDVEVRVNAADDDARASVYLTVSGTSAESGDDGEVGRGNRVNGLITPCRPMTLEAAAGKNPVTHVGKLYAVAAHAIAREVVEQIREATYAECYLASCLGRPVDDPALLDVRVRVPGGALSPALRARIEQVARAGVASVPSLWERLVRGEIRLY